MNRREFLTGAATALAVTSRGPGGIGPAGRPLNVLFLGGTFFVGPALVGEAVSRGHRVTLFNRGQTNPHLFPELARIRGNRYPDRDLGLGGLARGEWDAVIDTWQGSPLLVQETARMLKGRVGQYVYISSVAAFGSSYFRRTGVDETARLSPSPALPASADAELDYGARKRLSEEVLRRELPDNHCIHRCHAIVGCLPDGSVSDPKLAYWPVRIHQGGEILAPGQPSDTNQWLDVRDLAVWVLDSLEARRTGPYHTFRTQRMDEFLYGLKAITGRSGHLTWVPADFLFARDVASFVDVPMWVSHSEEEKGFYQFNNAKALGAGLKIRAMSETFSWIRDAFLARHSEDDIFDPRNSCCRVGPLEKTLLQAWKEKAGFGVGPR